MIWIENVELHGDDGGLYVLLCSSNRALIRPSSVMYISSPQSPRQYRSGVNVSVSEDCDGWLMHCGHTYAM